LREVVQVLQIILFIIPVAALWAMGALLLLKPVNILHHRWRLLVLIPLLAANILAIIENNLSSEGWSTLGWGLWLILGVDLVLGVGLWLTSRGFLIFGLTAQEVEAAITAGCREVGMRVTASQEEELLFFGGKEAVSQLHIEGDQNVDIRIRNRFNEIIVQAESKVGRKILKDLFPQILETKDAPMNKSRATGVLFIVLGLVFAVLGWIFFFEPRLILLE